MSFSFTYVGSTKGLKQAIQRCVDAQNYAATKAEMKEAQVHLNGILDLNIGKKNLMRLEVSGHRYINPTQPQLNHGHLQVKLEDIYGELVSETSEGKTIYGELVTEPHVDPVNASETAEAGELAQKE